MELSSKVSQLRKELETLRIEMKASLASILNRQQNETSTEHPSNLPNVPLSPDSEIVVDEPVPNPDDLQHLNASQSFVSPPPTHAPLSPQVVVVRGEGLTDQNDAQEHLSPMSESNTIDDNIQDNSASNHLNSKSLTIQFL